MASSKQADTSGHAVAAAPVAPWPGGAELVYQSVADALKDHCVHRSPALLVGYSGGMDSHVLLLAAWRWSIEHRGSVRAIYVNHQLQPESNLWAEHCIEVCAQLRVNCTVLSVDVCRQTGESPESTARDARYAAFKQQMTDNEYLLTAHHADDQAETVLLQLMRGSGLPGLAAMPAVKRFGCGSHSRPMLLMTRRDIASAAEAMKLNWIEDKSNTNTNFDRNYLRHRVLPLIKQRWPSAAKTVSRSAVHIAQATTLLMELAEHDVPLHSDVLDIARLQSLSKDRQINAIRAWISRHGYALPSTAKMQRFVYELNLASSSTTGKISFGKAEIRRHRHLLYLGEAGAFDESAPFRHEWSNRGKSLYIPETDQTISPDELSLPWIGDDEVIIIRSRRGGEKIHLAGQPYRQSVKSLLQQQGLPPWQRSRLPFVWCGEQLLGIIGLGFIAEPLRKEDQF